MHLLCLVSVVAPSQSLFIDEIRRKNSLKRSLRNSVKEHVKLLTYEPVAQEEEVETKSNKGRKSKRKRRRKHA